MSWEIKEVGYPAILSDTFKLFEKFILKHVDSIVALSSRTYDYCSRYNKKVELIPGFVELESFRPKIRKKDNVAFRTLGLIGPFFEPRKKENLRFLYQNIARFDKLVHILVIGICDYRIRDERMQYTGYLSSNQAYFDCIASLDAVLVPERMATTGIPNRIIDPMSCSVPVFTTPKGLFGLSYLESGKDIFVFEESELVDKINQLIFDDELMDKVGNCGKKVAEQYYSTNANTEKLTKVLESAIIKD
jgi:glycosyltransferase involved in cell wall biosynthesis